MRNNYNIIAVTPAGRKRYLELLYLYLKKNLDILDEWHLWINTQNIEDIEYIRSLSKNNYWIKTFDLDKNIEYHKFHSIGSFFKNCTDENTIYIRFDDDIVFIEDNFFETMIDFRINNPEYFLIFPCIINNSIVSHILQRIGAITTNIGMIEYDCFDHITYTHHKNTELIHNNFLLDYKNNNLDKYKFKKWILYNNERISINSFLFFGSDFKKFDGKVETKSEEYFLSSIYPIRKHLRNCVFGQSIVSHFSFHVQEHYLINKTNLLNLYKELIK